MPPLVDAPGDRIHEKGDILSYPTLLRILHLHEAALRRNIGHGEKMPVMGHTDLPQYLPQTLVTRLPDFGNGATRFR